MGTRGAWGFRHGDADTTLLAYVQSDACPEDLGLRVVKFIKDAGDFDNLYRVYDRQRLVGCDRGQCDFVSSVDISKVLSWNKNVFHNNLSTVDLLSWREATDYVRNNPSSLLMQYIQEKSYDDNPLLDLYLNFNEEWRYETIPEYWCWWYDSSDFIHDCVMCEHAYVIDLMGGRLEYYAGHVEPMDVQHGNPYVITSGDKYRTACKLIGTISLSSVLNVRTDVVVDQLIRMHGTFVKIGTFPKIDENGFLEHYNYI